MLNIVYFKVDTSFLGMHKNETQNHNTLTFFQASEVFQMLVDEALRVGCFLNIYNIIYFLLKKSFISKIVIACKLEKKYFKISIYLTASVKA